MRAVASRMTMLLSAKKLEPLIEKHDNNSVVQWGDPNWVCMKDSTMAPKTKNKVKLVSFQHRFVIMGDSLSWNLWYWWFSLFFFFCIARRDRQERQDSKNIDRRGATGAPRCFSLFSVCEWTKSRDGNNRNNKIHMRYSHKSTPVKTWQKEAACGNLCGMFYVYARNNALNNTSLLLVALVFFF